MTSALSAVDTAPQFRVQRAERIGRARAVDERIEIVDLEGEVVLSFGLGELYGLTGRLIEVGLDIGRAHRTIQGLLSQPVVTAADLAAVYEMGRQAGLRPVRTRSEARRA